MTSTGRVGRPADPAIGRALREAAEETLATRGYSELKVDRLVRQVGTTRAAFHRRYQSIDHLALEILMARFGGRTSEPTGSLLGDLIAIQVKGFRMFTDPTFARSVVGILAVTQNDVEIREHYRLGFVAPRREVIRGAITAAVQRGEIAREPADTEYICDLMIGPLLARLLLPTTNALDEGFARRTAETAYRELISTV